LRIHLLACRIIVRDSQSWNACAISKHYPFISTFIQFHIRISNIAQNISILILHKALSFSTRFSNVLIVSL
jgi:hypothetical protein